MGAATEFMVSVSKSWQTKERANSKAVPGPLLVVTAPSTTTRSSADLGPKQLCLDSVMVIYCEYKAHSALFAKSENEDKGLQNLMACKDVVDKSDLFCTQISSRYPNNPSKMDLI